MLVLFHTVKCRTFCSGETYYSYEGVIPRPQTSTDETIVIPERCYARMNGNNKLDLSCNTGYIVNDEHIFAPVTYGHTGSSLHVCGKDFLLNLHLFPTQNRIDGMTYISWKI